MKKKRIFRVWQNVRANTGWFLYEKIRRRKKNGIKFFRPRLREFQKLKFSIFFLQVVNNFFHIAVSLKNALVCY